MKLLVIGAGTTSSLICYNLKKCFKDALDIHIWEKSNEIGGRFLTVTSPTNPTCKVDLGAQYLTQNNNSPWTKPYFDELLKDGFIQRLDTTSLPGFHHDDLKTNFACTKGTQSIVQYYFQKAGVLDQIKTNQAATQIALPSELEAGAKGKVQVTSEFGIQEEFDLVVSTLPVPELLSLKLVDNLIQDFQDQFKKVSYTSRFALGIFLNEKIPLNATKVHLYPLNFVKRAENPIRYWSLENLKRNCGSLERACKEPASITVHTSVDYGAANLEKESDVVKDYLLDLFKHETDLIEDLSKITVVCHKWKYSQVNTSFPGSPGFVVLNQIPLILCTGDSFTYSGIEGCILSAEKSVEYLKNYIGSKDNY